jgi:hypothetical protein
MYSSAQVAVVRASKAGRSLSRRSSLPVGDFARFFRLASALLAAAAATSALEAGLHGSAGSFGANATFFFWGFALALGPLAA